MQAKVKLLSLAIATVLAGCATAPNEKTEQQAQAPVVKSAAPPAHQVEMAAPQKEVTPAPESDVVEVAPAQPAEAVAPSALPAMAQAEPMAEPKAEPARVHKLPTDPNTFLVLSGPKTKDHPYYGQGAQMGFTVNNVPGKDLVVVRGQKYTFKVDTGVRHDFYLTTSPEGWGAGTVTHGVEGQFIFQGDVTFSPDDQTPDLLYYECRNHKFMGGKIYVLDKGQSLADLKAKLGKDSAASGGAKAAPKMTVTEGAVKQKLGYAQMVLMSGSAKRVKASGNPEAIGLLDQARAKVDAAKASLAGGQLEQAMAEVNEGLQLVTAASRAITTESEMAGVNHRAQYDELLSSLKTYEGSYERNVARAKKTGQQLKATLDEAEYKRLVAEGKQLGGKGDYVEANKVLNKAQAMITSVLTDMLHAQTVVYDKSFETPKEEYEYELARVENYEELIPLAIEQKQPSERLLSLIDSFVKKAAKIKQEGVDIAAKGDYKMAIMAMQAATSNLQRALRMAGVQ